MAQKYRYITLTLFWIGYEIGERHSLGHEVVQGLTETGRQRGMNPLPESLTYLKFDRKPVHAGEIVEKFHQTFHEEIFVHDTYDVRIRNLSAQELVISHELYTPLARIHSPLNEPEYFEALSRHLKLVNGHRVPTINNNTTPNNCLFEG